MGGTKSLSRRRLPEGQNCKSITGITSNTGITGDERASIKSITSRTGATGINKYNRDKKTQEWKNHTRDIKT